MQDKPKDQTKSSEDYDLDDILDQPAVSNFMADEHENLSPRELTFRNTELNEPSYPFITVAAFIMACCIAHFLLVTQGFLGKKGMEKADLVASKLQDFFTKYSIKVPEGVELI